MRCKTGDHMETYTAFLIRNARRRDLFFEAKAEVGGPQGVSGPFSCTLVEQNQGIYLVECAIPHTCVEPH